MLIWPLELRAALVFIVGLVLGGQINRAIYRLAWSPRPIGPWSAPHADAPERRSFDRIPVLGWFGLEREAKLHGTWYWLRPLLIELLVALGLAALYVHECDGGLFVDARLPASTVHWQFLSHLVLLCLVTTATFIDLDEKTIPDSITIPGTIFGLSLAAAVPESLLPSANGTALWLSKPGNWSPLMDGAWGLVLGLSIVAAWCYALFPKTLTMRYGIVKAVRYLIASVLRHRMTWVLVVMGCVISCFVAAVWWRGGDHWQALLTSLVGLGFGGAIIWGIRVAASLAMGVEAMGFGDVTLLAMIGSFLGWQAALMVFLLSPFAGAVIALLQWLISGEREIAYGPFLSAGAVVVLVAWPTMWQRWGFIFGFGKWIPIAFFICLIPMALMLFCWRWFADRPYLADED